jgi:multimeric flavodoxin WrbA
MKVLAINSSPLKAKGNTDIILREFLKGLRENGMEVEQIYTHDLKIKPCLGRLTCWVKTPGKCCQKDDMASLLNKLSIADIWVFASPLYWDGVTGQMKNVFDRLLPLIKPFIEIDEDHCRHGLREGVKGGKVVLVSTCGFWELDNFDPLLDHVEAVCKNIHREFAGALIRPHGALLKYFTKNSELFNEILVAAYTAGYELVSNGKISNETMAHVSKELMPKNEYIEMINKNFERLMEKI